MVTSLQEIDHVDLRRMAALAKLLAHPLRLRIAVAMSSGEVTSSATLAEEFDEMVTTVAYHVRALHKGGALRLVDERQVRGATEHFYLLSPDVWEELRDLIGAINTGFRSARVTGSEWWWSVGIAALSSGV